MSDTSFSFNLNAAGTANEFNGQAVTHAGVLIRSGAIAETLSIEVQNSVAAEVWVKLYDALSVTVATDVPKVKIAVGANKIHTFQVLGNAYAWGTGVYVRVTANGADDDNTTPGGTVNVKVSRRS